MGVAGLARIDLFAVMAALPLTIFDYTLRRGQGRLERGQSLLGLRNGGGEGLTLQQKEVKPHNLLFFIARPSTDLPKAEMQREAHSRQVH